MKNIIINITAIGNLMMLSPAFAAAASQPLSVESLCRRLVVSEDVLIFDSTGTRIKNVLHQDRNAPSGLSSPESRSKDGKVCSNSGTSVYSSDDLSQPVAFTFQWSVKTDGALSFSFEQGTGTDRTGNGSQIKDSVGKQLRDVKDFTPFTWTSPLHTKERVVIRLTPSLSPEGSSQSLTHFPIVLEDATVFDGKGRLWTAGFTAKGEALGIMTVQGAFVASYQEFSGAKKIGLAQGREIRFKTEDGTSVVIKSSTPILPGNMKSDVYIFLDQNSKSENIGSQYIVTRSKGEEALRDLLDRKSHKNP